MLRIALFAGYAILLIIDVVALGMHNNLVHGIAKILLMPMLIAQIYTVKKSTQQKNWKRVLLALIFSWAGDTLLLFEHIWPWLFIAGLISFLVAHLCYISYFNRYRLATVANWHRKNLALTLLVLAWSIGLFIYLSGSLGPLLIPVAVYCVVITAMMLIASGLQYTTPSRVYRLLVSGAAFFVISDSVLAVNKFALPFEGAGMIIMLTYGIAQLLLVNGAVNNSDLRIR
jgi:uncharacterized membrane protein YhhN